jgi:zinc protease
VTALVLCTLLAVHLAYGKDMNPLTQPPDVTPTKAFTPPTPTVFTLSNGVPVWLIHRPDLPLVSLRMVLPGGSSTDPTDASGLSAFADALLLKGAGDRDAVAFAKAMEQHAIEIDSGTGVNASWVSLAAHSDSLSLAMDLFADAVRRPRFEASDIDRERDIRIGELAEAADDARTVSGWVFDQVYFGEGHPLAHPVLGTASSVSAHTQGQIRASWRDRFGANRAHFIAAGDVDQATLQTQLEKRFADWGSADGALVDIDVDGRKPDGPRLFFVDQPGTSQTSLRVGMPAPAFGAADFESALLGSVVLGGTFTSRLNRLLREEKGYTYGARAGVHATADFGMLVATTNVQLDVSAPALVDLLGEITRYAEGIDEAELSKAQSAQQTRTVEAMSSRGGVVAVLAGHALNGRPPDALAKSLERSRVATTQSVAAAIQGSSLDRGVVVVVGDLAQIREPIEKAVPGEWTVVSAHE